MQYTEKMLEACEELRKLGHYAFLSNLHGPMIGKTDEEKEVIKLQQKNNQDAIKDFSAYSLAT